MPPGGISTHVIGHEVAAAVGMGEAAARAVPVPAARLEREQVEAEVEMDRDALAVRPVQIGIDQEPAAEVAFGRFIHDLALDDVTELGAR